MEVVKSKDLIARKVTGLAIDEPYGTIIGRPELPFSHFVWGPPGSGKSTLTLGILNSLVRVTGAAGMYTSAEEGTRGSIVKRAQRIGANEDNLVFTGFSDLEALKSAIIEHHIRFIVIDSTTVIDPERKSAVGFQKWLVSRGISPIWVAHARAGNDGQFKGGSRLPHEVDTVIMCFINEKGRHIAEATKNRWADPDSGFRINIPMKKSEIDKVARKPIKPVVSEKAAKTKKMQGRRAPKKAAPRVVLRLADILQKGRGASIGVGWMNNYIQRYTAGTPVKWSEGTGALTFTKRTRTSKKGRRIHIAEMRAAETVVDSEESKLLLRDALRRLVLRNKHREIQVPNKKQVLALIGAREFQRRLKTSIPQKA